MVENICLWCGNKFERSKPTQCCSKECGISFRHKNTHEEISCMNCGEIFEARIEAKRKYCSLDCKQKHRTKESKVETVCQYCGKIYFVKNWQHNQYLDGKKKYECCSNVCSNRLISKNNTGENNSLFTSVKRNCDWCGKEYVIQKSIENTSKFCSNRCHTNHKIEKAKIELRCHFCGDIFICKKGDVDFWGEIKYCSSECRRLASRKRIDLICTVCGKEYWQFPSYAGTSVACSNECKNIWLKEYSNRPETIERLKKQGAASQKNSKTEYTLPEKIVLQYLEENNISFIPQYVIGEILVADFFLPDYNCVLEVYGDYWHSNPEIYGNGENLKPLNETQARIKKRDFRRYYVITRNYKHFFYNIWENEIKKDIHATMSRFFKHIDSKIRNESVV